MLQAELPAKLKPWLDVAGSLTARLKAACQGGKFNVRVLAERWYRAAPEDADWAFFPARPADHARLSRTVSWNDHELDLAHTSVSLRVDHASGRIEADLVVLAAGAWSARLLRPLGLRVPLETQRGYHVMVPDAGVRLSRPIVPADRKAFLTPMEGGLRGAGTVEVGGFVGGKAGSAIGRGLKAGWKKLFG